MNFDSIISQLTNLKATYDELLQGLMGIGLVDDYPEISFDTNYSHYDVTDYRQIYNDLNLSRSCVNWLITLTNQNGFITDDGDELSPVDFVVIDLIDGQELSAYCTNKLKEMQTLLDKLKAILVENNVIAK